jgi:hypothetical protein
MVVRKVSMISIFFSYIYFIFPCCLSTYIYCIIMGVLCWNFFPFSHENEVGFETDGMISWVNMMIWDMNVCLRIMAAHLLGLGLGLVLVWGIESDLGVYGLTGFLVLWANLTVSIILLYSDNSKYYLLPLWLLVLSFFALSLTTFHIL